MRQTIELLQKQMAGNCKRFKRFAIYLWQNFWTFLYRFEKGAWGKRNETSRSRHHSKRRWNHQLEEGNGGFEGGNDGSDLSANRGYLVDFISVPCIINDATFFPTEMKNQINLGIDEQVFTLVQADTGLLQKIKGVFVSFLRG